MNKNVETRQLLMQIATPAAVERLVQPEVSITEQDFLLSQITCWIYLSLNGCCLHSLMFSSDCPKSDKLSG